MFQTSGPNLVIFAWLSDELSCGQTSCGQTSKSDFEVKIDLEGQGWSPPKTMGILTKLFCTSGQNWWYLAWTGHELLRAQACNWWTHRQTDTHTQTTTIPKAITGLGWKWYLEIYQYNLIHAITICFFHISWSILSSFPIWRYPILCTIIDNIAFSYKTVSRGTSYFEMIELTGNWQQCV